MPITSLGQSGGCIDPSLIDPEAACLEIYDPVCGCDGNTYSNSCYALVQAGVTTWTPGECQVVAVESCTDLVGIDFGQCDMALGIAVVGGQCVSLSGCGWTVGSTDYSAAFHPSFEHCLACLEVQTVEPCTDLAGVDFGPCLAFMGVGVYEGQCQFVSGCGPLVGNMDYSASVYATMEECQTCLDIQTVEPCTDLSGINFGFCAAVLGVGVINNQCQAISGCGTTVGNVDYSPAIYSSMEECQACITGVGTPEMAELVVWPNPADGFVSITSGMADAQVILTDLSGRVVLQKQVRGGRSDIDLAGLRSGVYMLSVITHDAVRTVRLTVR